MRDCIINAHCTEFVCDRACPTYVEISYLLERNGIMLNSAVFNTPQKDRQKAVEILHKAQGKLLTVISDNTIALSNLITYCGICENWKGNTLHCSVYNLKLSSHLDDIQQSWSLKEMPEKLEMENIWINTAKILIISNLDYVQFKDFQAQTLLNLIHKRTGLGLTTIVVSPQIGNLIGSGDFYKRLQTVLREAVIK